MQAVAVVEQVQLALMLEQMEHVQVMEELV
jgi:hypothetical protein